MDRPRFHIAFPVTDLAAARAFYAGLLGCAEGRATDHWVDFDLFGHQVVAHKVDRAPGPAGWSTVDGDAVPVPHYGLILSWRAFEVLARRLEAAGQRFVIPPRVRFAGRPGEQATLFLLDPSGNALEFKAFRNEDAIFALDPELEG